MVPNEGRSSGSGGEEVEWSTLRGLERATESISKSDIGSKIDAGRLPWGLDGPPPPSREAVSI